MNGFPPNNLIVIVVLVLQLVVSLLNLLGMVLAVPSEQMAPDDEIQVDVDILRIRDAFFWCFGSFDYQSSFEHSTAKVAHAPVGCQLKATSSQLHPQRHLNSNFPENTTSFTNPFRSHESHNHDPDNT